MMPHLPGLMIAAPSSNSGKTVITLAILRALANRGIAVTAAKAGPDYIDPAFQAAASRQSCINLDPWAMSSTQINRLAARQVAGGRVMICEAAMGLFDGAADGSGASADLAALMNWPVVLVMDVRGQAASAAAVIAGFAHFRRDVRIAGVILNKVGSSRHRDMIVAACAKAIPDIPVLGAVRRHDDLVLPERHLGLVQASEHAGLDGFLQRAATIIAEDIDLAALQALIPPAQTGEIAVSDTRAGMIAPLGHRIAIARDDAFAFAYPHLMDDWRDQGAELSFFSPLADQGPDAGCDAVYLPGGYPELYGGVLAAAENFKSALHRAAARDIPVYGECGGYMVLGDTLIDGAGHAHAMAGLLPLVTSFADRELHLGYRDMTLTRENRLGGVGDRWRGHEFHYARTLRADGPGWLTATTADGRNLGETGLINGSVFGSFLHLICAAAT
ncbi:cobyrinate a,c-diamide synthase [Thalassospira sp.]|uniref:cobyrinate a,c-diamide synthase n=1 Tax=Thalassospira sp. TaxID=1912094 RepID=UPI002735BE82|nr:cobyrinate a,c-diamide synthase [Thalassospira sp.]MDP2700424.1 cobyrinate a,c-diamide synthase [Thalassospira sp.]